MENLTELEGQTISNCIDNGFGTKIQNQLINLMRKKKVDYLGRNQVGKIHTFKRWSDGSICFPSNFILETTDSFCPEKARKTMSISIDASARNFYKSTAKK